MTWEMVVSFGLGLVFGSFVNVLTYRLPRILIAEFRSETNHQRFDLFWPASHCPHCQTQLVWWHNIPVLSYLWLKGRCSTCHHSIGMQYPLSELATAFLWLSCSWHWGFNPIGFCWAGCATLLLALSIIDWQTSLLPDDLTQILVWSGLIASALGWLALPLSQSVWGAVIGYTSLRCIATIFELITGKQGMGAGDFKLLAGLGAWFGPLALLPLVMMASISGAAIGLFLKWTHRLSDDGYVPFGPFLSLAAICVAFIGIDPMAIWIN